MSQEMNRQTLQDQHLLSDKNFQQLSLLREEIYQATQVKPSMKKLVNLIIEEVNFNLIRQQLIQKYS